MSAQIEVVSKGNRSLGFGIPKGLLKYGVPLALAGLGVYLVVKNAGGIASFFGNAASGFGSYVSGSIQNAFAGLKLPDLSAGTTKVYNPVTDPTLKLGSTASVIGTDGQSHLVGQDVIKQAELSLGGQLGSTINLANNPDVKAAENAIIAGLNQNNVSSFVGYTVVGDFKLPNGDVVPLSQAAVDYYNSAHVPLTEIVKF